MVKIQERSALSRWVLYLLGYPNQRFLALNMGETLRFRSLILRLPPQTGYYSDDHIFLPSIPSGQGYQEAVR